MKPLVALARTSSSGAMGGTATWASVTAGNVKRLPPLASGRPAWGALHYIGPTRRGVVLRQPVDMPGLASPAVGPAAVGGRDLRPVPARWPPGRGRPFPCGQGGGRVAPRGVADRRRRRHLPRLRVVRERGGVAGRR